MNSSQHDYAQPLDFTVSDEEIHHLLKRVIDLVGNDPRAAISLLIAAYVHVVISCSEERPSLEQMGKDAHEFISKMVIHGED